MDKPTTPDTRSRSPPPLLEISIFNLQHHATHHTAYDIFFSRLCHSQYKNFSLASGPTRLVTFESVHLTIKQSPASSNRPRILEKVFHQCRGRLPTDLQMRHEYLYLGHALHAGFTSCTVTCAKLTPSLTIYDFCEGCQLPIKLYTRTSTRLVGFICLQRHSSPMVLICPAHHPHPSLSFQNDNQSGESYCLPRGSPALQSINWDYLRSDRTLAMDYTLDLLLVKDPESSKRIWHALQTIQRRHLELLITGRHLGSCLQ
ncbi:hypothetical protein BT63DRAFT_430226 [Microthyrium microscopicum]|uniref:Uncharacterized protein n=1 Tax=Microthyrium microscopicum TaxID=703497 RepID=A0A6A6TXR7_9PEZI|nr:hypothetical protein BT63DRAFT_430226 [Microthyrium microscopicum]